jgi:AbrB family looped-hinge helix DNA binding protein
VKVKISSKGQISIPAHYRKKFSVKTGDEVNIIESGDHLLIYPLKSYAKTELENIFNSLKGIWSKMEKNGTVYVREIREGGTRDVWQ